MKKIILFPPVYFFSFILFMALLFFVFPVLNLIKFPFNLIGLIFLLFGGCLSISCLILFKKHKTAINYKESSSIISEGPYKFSRNPQYLGELSILIGLSVLTGNVVSFVFPILFFLIINIMFIPYEEQKMENTFGSKYLDYKNKVRKWI